MTDFGEIIAFRDTHDQRLVQLPAAELDTMQEEELAINHQAYLGTDVFQGMYGVTSFGIVVPRPHNRPRYYSAQEGPCGDYEEEDVDYTDLVRKAHFLNAELGFAVVRTVIAPVEVVTKLRSDRYLGVAVVDKCCLDEVLPEDFDEDHELDLSAALRHDKAEAVDITQKRVQAEVEATTGHMYTAIREYPSWHGYRMYNSVMTDITEACKATVANFDELLTMLRTDLQPLYPFDQDTPVGRLSVRQSLTE